jgi:hypothetical protein
MAAEMLQFNGGTLSDLRTAFTVASGTVNIENAQGEILGARISVTGSARLPSANRPGSIDLKGTASGVDLSVLGDRVPFNVKGPVEAGFTIKGELPGPELAISGQSPSIVLAGLNLSDLSFNARGNGSKMTLEELKGSAGEGVLTAKGTALFGPDGLDMDFSMEGSDLDLARITKEVKGNGTPDLSGILDVSLSGSMKGGKWNGRGEIFSERMTAFGLDFEDASLHRDCNGQVEHQGSRQGHRHRPDRKGRRRPGGQHLRKGRPGPVPFWSPGEARPRDGKGQSHRHRRGDIGFQSPQSHLLRLRDVLYPLQDDRRQLQGRRERRVTSPG